MQLTVKYFQKCLHDARLVLLNNISEGKKFIRAFLNRGKPVQNEASTSDQKFGMQPISDNEKDQKIDICTKTDQMVDIQLISDADTYWEQILPIDYEDIIKQSKDIVLWENKKDLYFVLCKGFLMSYGEEWFYIAKDGKKCLLLPARLVLQEDRWKWEPEPETRFEEVAYCIFDTFSIFCKFNSKMLSPQTTYTAFLVYKLPDDYKIVDQPPYVRVVDIDSDSDEEYKIILHTPQTFNSSSKPKTKYLRSDGWMEVQVHKFEASANIKMISMRLRFSGSNTSLKGVIVQGVDLKPI